MSPRNFDYRKENKMLSFIIEAAFKMNSYTRMLQCGVFVLVLFFLVEASTGWAQVRTISGVSNTSANNQFPKSAIYSKNNV